MTKEKAEAVAAFNAGMAGPSHNLPGVRALHGQGSASPALSPSTPGFYYDRAGTPRSRFSPSPDYPDILPHGGFDPNAYYDPAAGRQIFFDPSGGPPTRRLPFTTPSEDAGEYQHEMGGPTPGDDEIHEIIVEGT